MIWLYRCSKRNVRFVKYSKYYQKTLKVPMHLKCRVKIQIRDSDLEFIISKKIAETIIFSFKIHCCLSLKLSSGSML